MTFHLSVINAVTWMTVRQNSWGCRLSKVWFG